eukprot:3690747-Alexandrium_andersonii.AAC.1
MAGAHTISLPASLFSMDSARDATLGKTHLCVKRNTKHARELVQLMCKHCGHQHPHWPKEARNGTHARTRSHARAHERASAHARTNNYMHLSEVHHMRSNIIDSNRQHQTAMHQSA